MWAFLPSSHCAGNWPYLRNPRKTRGLGPVFLLMLPLTDTMTLDKPLRLLSPFWLRLMNFSWKLFVTRTISVFSQYRGTPTLVVRHQNNTLSEICNNACSSTVHIAAVRELTGHGTVLHGEKLTIGKNRGIPSLSDIILTAFSMLILHRMPR